MKYTKVEQIKKKVEPPTLKSIPDYSNFVFVNYGGEMLTDVVSVKLPTVCANPNNCAVLAIGAVAAREVRSDSYVKLVVLNDLEYSLLED